MLVPPYFWIIHGFGGIVMVGMVFSRLNEEILVSNYRFWDIICSF